MRLILRFDNLRVEIEDSIIYLLSFYHDNRGGVYKEAIMGGPFYSEI